MKPNQAINLYLRFVFFFVYNINKFKYTLLQFNNFYNHSFSVISFYIGHLKKHTPLRESDNLGSNDRLCRHVSYILLIIMFFYIYYNYYRV